MFYDFEAAHEAVVNIFGAYAYRQYLDKNEYESRFNRAIYDVMLYVFRVAEYRRVLEKNKTKVKHVFEELCLNKDFSTSITYTTKSKQAVTTRMNSWIKALNAEFSLKIKNVRIS